MVNKLKHVIIVLVPRTSRIFPVSMPRYINCIFTVNTPILHMYWYCKISVLTLNNMPYTTNIDYHVGPWHVGPRVTAQGVQSIRRHCWIVVLGFEVLIIDQVKTTVALTYLFYFLFFKYAYFKTTYIYSWYR